DRSPGPLFQSTEGIGQRPTVRETTASAACSTMAAITTLLTFLLRIMQPTTATFEGRFRMFTCIASSELRQERRSLLPLRHMTRCASTTSRTHLVWGRTMCAEVCAL